MRDFGIDSRNLAYLLDGFFHLLKITNIGICYSMTFQFVQSELNQKFTRIFENNSLAYF